MLCTSESKEARVQRLYEQYGPYIRKRCHRMLKNRAEAEDATQEIFIRALVHVSKFGEHAELLPWLNRICRNYCANQVRNRGDKQELMAELPERTDEDFETRAVCRDFSEQFLAQMSHEEREIINQVHVDEVPQQAVAENLGVSRRTIVYRLSAVAKQARTYDMAWMTG